MWESIVVVVEGSHDDFKSVVRAEAESGSLSRERKLWSIVELESDWYKENFPLWSERAQVGREECPYGMEQLVEK